jgi:ankyrin repeat protein
VRKEEMSLSTEEQKLFREKAKKGELDDEFKSLFQKAGNKQREDCLYHATWSESFETVKHMIEEGKVDVDCKEDGASPITGAATVGNNKIIEYLLSVGANINAKISEDWNPLHVAACYSQFDTVKLLVSLGCDFNAKDKQGKTPLKWAQQALQDEIAEFLTQVQQK